MIILFDNKLTGIEDSWRINHEPNLNELLVMEQQVMVDNSNKKFWCKIKSLFSTVLAIKIFGNKIITPDALRNGKVRREIFFIFSSSLRELLRNRNF